MDNRPIGLLDSGLGGLSVVKKVIKKLPNESTIFIGDNAHMPYGNRTKEDIIDLTRKSVKFLLKNDVKLVIIACNTATATAMDTIEKEIDPQVIGVIQSGALAAARTTKNKKVAVVATSVIVASHAYEKELHFRDPEIKVTELAAPKLAPLVEAQEDHATNLKVVKESLVPLQGKGFDTLVLGCTHYPLIQREFTEAINDPKVTILDPADQVAQYTFNVMHRDGLFSEAGHQAEHKYYTTGNADSFDKLARTFMDDAALTSEHVDTENE